VPRFIQREIFSVKIDPERWLVLMKKGFHDWNLRVLGPEPLDVELLKLTDHEAKCEALTLAQKHFRAVNPGVKIPRFQRWRLALSSERGYPNPVTVL
jgi:hypothetical protein